MGKYLLLLAVILSAFSIQRPSLPPEIKQEILQRVLELIQTHFSQPQFLSQLLPFQANPTCSACHSVVSSIQHTPAKQVIKGLERIAVEYCVFKKIQIREVCKGAIGYETRYLLQSLWAKIMDPHSLCHKIRVCPKQYQILNSEDYIIDILKDKPNREQQQPTRTHVSDIHPDFFYVPNTPTTCNQPVCCRDGVVGKPNAKLAGYWGSNEGDCDLPFQTFNLFLNQLKNKSVDAIVWTGDNTAHDIWRQSESYNANFTRVIADRIKEVLPNVVVMPAIGNHECFPVNIYQWDKQQSLNTYLGLAWEPWIGSEAKQMMKKNGYFSFRVAKFNLVVLSLNTQAWSHENFILLANPTDPGKQLEWMEKVLRKAESDGDWVYILGHIPPNDGLNEWSQRYNGLMNRFHYIIRGQFFGHQHSDHIAFVNKINSSKIIGYCLIAPSLTTASNKNPNYRIMNVDIDTMRVLDYEQYALKLEKNYTKQDTPQFEVTYRFVEEYGLQSFDFGELERFKQLLKTDEKTQVKYAFHRDGDLKPGKADNKTVCETFGSEKQVIECRNGKLELSRFQKVAGPWRKLIK